MFKNANSVTRPDKALILGFMAGYIENPRPSLDNVLVIKLGETKVCFIVLIKVNKKNLISFSENKISNRCVSIKNHYFLEKLKRILFRNYNTGRNVPQGPGHFRLTTFLDIFCFPFGNISHVV